MTVDTGTTDAPRKLRTHELVLLHGQPGSPADWLAVAGRPPARFHAIVADRPGYGASQRAAGGFAANARAVLHELDSRGIERAVLVGHSYGGGVALSVASAAPHRVEAVVLLASVGPGCVNGWDRLLAAPGAGPLCALLAWRLTPWIARAWLAHITRRRGQPPDPGEYANWQVWCQAGREHGRLMAHFPDRATRPAAGTVRTGACCPVDPAAGAAARRPPRHHDSRRDRLAQALPHARLQLVGGAGHHLPRRAAAVVASAIVAFVAEAETADCPL